jgi:hypothetical protein
MKTLLALTTSILFANVGHAGTFTLATCGTPGTEVTITQVSVQPDRSFTSISVRHGDRISAFYGPLDQSIEPLSFTLVGKSKSGESAWFARQGSRAELKVSGQKPQSLICYQPNSNGEQLVEIFSDEPVDCLDARATLFPECPAGQVRKYEQGRCLESYEVERSYCQIRN